MQRAQQETMPPGANRVLACATAEGHTVEVVERADGSLAILVAGAEIPHFQWGPGQVEPCMNTYLRLLRH
jgi:hypothetical protein